jgi:dihydrofolate reductase
MSHTTSSPLQAGATMPPPPSHALSLTLILAATPSLGIGRAGTLPWPQLRKEMAYFKRVTSRVVGPATAGGRTRCNAVVMGRKTWESIPARFRPLEERVNVVVTRTPDAFASATAKEGAGGVVAVGSVGEALERLEGYNAQSGAGGAEALGGGQRAPEIARVFVIGGATIYDAALGLPQTERVLLTKIEAEYECDTFFSADLDESGEWKRSTKEELEGWTGEKTEVVEEKGVRFEFGMYERVG